MSDIYLQITETPTVVTLSAPVVSGALASTVTVANTVTVALDSNSLSALENVTVTVGAAITGTVTVSNFPATQPISIASVTIGNTVTIAGTVTANDSGALSIVNSSTVTKADVKFTAIAGAYNASEFASTYSLRPLSTNSGGTLLIDGNVAGDSILGYDGWAYVRVAQSPGSVVTVGSLPAISGTVTVGNTVTISGTVTANPTGTQTIAGTVTANLGGYSQTAVSISGSSVTAIPVALQTNGIYGGTLLAYNGANTYLRVGLDSVGGNSLAFGGSVPISGTVTVGNSVTISSLPALAAGTAQIGSVTASISNSVTIASLPAISGTVTANTFALQGTAVTTSNFTSTTASTVLANYNATREVLSIFNEGAGNLHICAGATCTTIAYQVRLSAGDYYEVPSHQTTITHSAVFATAGTARVTEVS